MRTIVLEARDRGLLISMLLLDYRKVKFIVPCFINKKILEKMQKYDLEVKVSEYGVFEGLPVKGVRKYCRYYYNLLKYFPSKNELTNIEVYGDDELSISIPYRNIGINVIEDGIINYKKRVIKRTMLEKIKKKLKLIENSDKAYGFDERVKKIYLTGLGPVPQELSSKVEFIDLKKLWEKKTRSEQEEILDIFSFNLNTKKKLKGKEIILLTQPLSEDGVISEDEKIKLYSKIIKKYDQKKLIIKRHPREKTNYKDIFKDCLVIDDVFPFEIFNLLDIKFQKAITLFSTAASAVDKNIEIDFYGTEVHPKILEKFGSCDNIMKRNCFLED